MCIKRFKFTLAKDFPFYIEGEVVGILPIGTQMVLDLPVDQMHKASDDGYITIVEEQEVPPYSA